MPNPDHDRELPLRRINPNPDTWRDAIAGISENVNALRGMPVADDDLADAVHIIRELEKLLALIRREHEDEAAEAIPKGERLEGKTQSRGLASTPSNTYSFSTARILADTMDGMGEGTTITQALTFLADRGALRLEWLVSKVRPTLSALGVAVFELPQEITDDDMEAHIGKATTWSVSRDT